MTEQWSYDNFNCAFDFLPGAAGGIYPAILHLIPSIFLPFSNLIEWHAIISPLAASSDKWRRTLASEMPVATAISVSICSPCFFRYCRISFIYYYQKQCGRRGGVYTNSAAASKQANSRTGSFSAARRISESSMCDPEADPTKVIASVTQLKTLLPNIKARAFLHLASKISTCFRRREG